MGFGTFEDIKEQKKQKDGNEHVSKKMNVSKINNDSDKSLENSLKKELSEYYGTLEGQKIFDTVGKIKIDSLRLKNPEILNLPKKKIIAILKDEIFNNLNEDIQETSEDIQETSEDIQETSEDIQETSEDIQETYVNARNVLQSLTENIKVTQEDVSNFQDMFGSEKLLLLRNTLNKIPESVGIDPDEFIDSFSVAGAKWLQVQKKVWSGENVTPEEESFLDEFSTMCDTLDISLPEFKVWDSSAIESRDSQELNSLSAIARNPEHLMENNLSLQKYMKSSKNDKDIPEIRIKKDKHMLEMYRTTFDEALTDEQKKVLDDLIAYNSSGGVLENPDPEGVHTENIQNTITTILQNKSAYALKKSVVKNCFTALNTYFNTTQSTTLNFSQDFSCDERKGIFFDGNIMKMKGEIQGKKIGVTYDLKTGTIQFDSFITYNPKDKTYDIGDNTQQITKLKVPRKENLYAEIGAVDLNDVVQDSASIDDFESTLSGKLDTGIANQFSHNELNKYYIEKNVAREYAQQGILDTLEQFSDPLDTRSLQVKFDNFASIPDNKKECIALLFKSTEKQANPDLLRDIQSNIATLVTLLSSQKIRDGKTQDAFINSQFSLDARKDNPNAIYDLLLAMKKGSGEDAYLDLIRLKKTVQLLSEGKTVENIFWNTKLYSEYTQLITDKEKDNAEEKLAQQLAELDTSA